MRIISPFKDYYDSALAYGMDPNLVYCRETTSQLAPVAWNEMLESFMLADTFRAYRNHDEPNVKLAMIGFCGLGYRAWFSTDLATADDRLGAPIALAMAKDLVYEDARRITNEAGYRTAANRLDRAFAELLVPVDLPVEWFIELAAPCFLVTLADPWGEVRHPIVVNPRLSALGFEEFVTPFKAFQEIAMFLGQQLAVEDMAPRTVGDDRDIAQSKGFDDQSFRTAAPGHKKENRKANRLRKKNGTNETDPS